MFTLRASFLSVVNRKIVPYHGSARIPRLTLWLFVFYSKSLKSPWIPLYGLEKSLNFSQYRIWSVPAKLHVKIRVFFRFNFVKKTNKKNCKELCNWKRQSRTRAKMWADTRLISGCVYELKCSCACYMELAWHYGVKAFALAFVLPGCFAAKCLESAVLAMHVC